MIDVCSRCGSTLGFQPLNQAVYDYIDAVCDDCFSYSYSSGDGHADWWLQLVDVSHDDFAPVNEMNCD